MCNRWLLLCRVDQTPGSPPLQARDACQEGYEYQDGPRATRSAARARAIRSMETAWLCVPAAVRGMQIAEESRSPSPWREWRLSSRERRAEIGLRVEEGSRRE